MPRAERHCQENPTRVSLTETPLRGLRVRTATGSKWQADAAPFIRAGGLRERLYRLTMPPKPKPKRKRAAATPGPGKTKSIKSPSTGVGVSAASAPRPAKAAKKAPPKLKAAPKPKKPRSTYMHFKKLYAEAKGSSESEVATCASLRCPV